MVFKSLPIGAPEYGLQGISRIEGGAADPISTTNGIARKPWLFTKVELRLPFKDIEAAFLLVVDGAAVVDVDEAFDEFLLVAIFLSIASSIAVG